ncbi:4-coumarate--CoA ligase 1 [Ixodes scapularis]|uniref:4-coumarate--CoA ligase 1 n=1 Tax=Ixodes scapularis TaxID=6945 RepID=UPI001C395533|nr:4-coumarate--CoA ligase 1 [Ixodes scapularis]
MAALITDGVISSPFADFDTKGRSAAQVITEYLNKLADKVVAVDTSTSLTAGQLLSKARRYAAGFQKWGVAPGARVCAHLHNTVESMAAAFAVMFAGGTVVLARTTLVARELLYQIRDSECSFVLTDELCTGTVLQIKDDHPLKGLFVIGNVTGFTNIRQFEELSEDSLREYVPSDTKDEVAAIVYTSGSTGLPKGVEISHSAYVSSLLAIETVKICTEDDVYLASNPLTHLSGFVLNGFCMCLGATVVYREPTISLHELIEVIEKHKVTLMVSFPAKMQSLFIQARRTGVEVPSVKTLAIGGSPITKSLGKDLRDLFRCETLVNVYGMSEVAGLISTTPKGQVTLEHSGFAGPGTKIKIIDINTGATLGPFEHGEIYVQSKSVMRAYYKKPEATAASLDKDGWLKTGDLGYYDEEGHLYFVERLKEMIKCMDNQLAPAELEQILLAHDAVKEVVVVGVPSIMYGEAPAASVVLDDACQLPKKEIKRKLIELVAGQTAVYKHLYAGVIFVDFIPKAENGKVMRQELRSKCVTKEPTDAEK